jgi:hypothetical protein
MARAATDAADAAGDPFATAPGRARRSRRRAPPARPRPAPAVPRYLSEADLRSRLRLELNPISGPMWTATSRLIQSIAGLDVASRGPADVTNPCRLPDRRAAIRSATSPIADQRPSEGSMFQPLPQQQAAARTNTVARCRTGGAPPPTRSPQRMGSRHDPSLALVVPTAPTPHPYLDIVWRRRSEASAKRSSMYANRSLRDGSHVAEQPATRWETAFATVASGNSDSRGAQRRRADSVQPRHAPLSHVVITRFSQQPPLVALK